MDPDGLIWGSVRRQKNKTPLKQRKHQELKKTLIKTLNTKKQKNTNKTPILNKIPLQENTYGTFVRLYVNYVPAKTSRILSRVELEDVDCAEYRLDEEP